VTRRPRARLVALLAAALLIGAALAGGRFVLVTRMPGEPFQGPLPPLTAAQRDLASRLESHVHALAVRIGERNLFRYPALLAAADYVEAEFRSAGHEPRSQGFEVQGQEVRNVEVALTGRAPALVVVGAHYDSVAGSPGANDNATGVAAVLELARLLGGRTHGCELRLVAFVNEEPPFFGGDEMGSMRYARALAERGEQVAAMLSLETIGYYSDQPGSQRFPFPLGWFYPDTGNFIGFVGNLGSRAQVRRATAAFRRHAQFPSHGLAAPGWMTGIGWSDQLAFWRHGFPGVMVTDTALFRYRQYHRPDDLPHVVDHERLARVVEGLAAVIPELCPE